MTPGRNGPNFRAAQTDLQERTLGRRAGLPATGKANNKNRAALRSGVGQNFTAMALDNLFTGSQPQTGTFEYVPAMQTDEGLENFFQIARGQANAVIGNRNLTDIIDDPAADRDRRPFFLPSILEGIGNQVLEKLPNLDRVSMQVMQRLKIYPGPGTADYFLQIADHIPNQFIHIQTLKAS
jgi:hypothetical protein